jgi:hypothetical protein
MSWRGELESNNGTGRDAEARDLGRMSTSLHSSWYLAVLCVHYDIHAAVEWIDSQHACTAGAAQDGEPAIGRGVNLTGTIRSQLFADSTVGIVDWFGGALGVKHAIEAAASAFIKHYS